MAAKIPAEAFDYYFALGPARSYQEVAERYGVTKRAITRLATRERWQERMDRLEAKAREATDKKAVETLEAMNTRHLKSLRVIQGKALEALRSMPIQSAMDAVRALDMAIKQERLVRGEPSDRTVLSFEDRIRREYESWLSIDEDGADGADGIEGEDDGDEHDESAA